MNIREVGKKIKSVSNVRKITNAMQLVSAVKMKKAQVAASEGKPYQMFLEDAIREVSKKVDVSVSPLLAPVKEARRRQLMILVTSNKGLCGAFNLNLIRTVFKDEQFKNTDFIAVGKKGSVLVAVLGGQVVADFSSPTPMASVPAVFDMAVDSYLAGKYDRIVIAYNSFVNIVRYDPVIDTLLPFTLTVTGVQEKATDSGSGKQYLVEPDASGIMQELIKNYIEEKIRFTLIQSEAGEHSARMMAMKNATDNATEVIGSLTQLKNKLRQQKITYELLDMITAKESVEVN